MGAESSSRGDRNDFEFLRAHVGPGRRHALVSAKSVSDEAKAPATANDAAREAAEQMGDPSFAEKLEDLSPDQIAVFVEMLHTAARKQRIMAFGYLAALVALLAGLGLAFVLFANAERGTFIGWVFLIPFTLCATILYVVGRITKRMSIRVQREVDPASLPPEARAIVEKARAGELDAEE